MKERLVELPSGGIDLAVVDGELRLQFNTTCLEALPYCQAMCCRVQKEYSATLVAKDKLVQLGLTRTSKSKETGEEILVLPVKPENPNECLFLDHEHLCSVHQIKPEECGNWHCSPGGVGEGLRTRASGWRLVPTQR